MPLRIHIGMALQSGPWGGGNTAMGLLSEYLSQRGAQVAHDLSEPGADVILLTDPRRQLKSCAFDHRGIVRYLLRNPRALVVHRINECDERKGTEGLNALLTLANRCADHTVFVATWLEKLFRDQGLAGTPTSVIRNGSDRRLFHPKGYLPWDGRGPMKLVTHHWGGHWMKGFDVYQRLDELLAKDGYRDEVEFTYIGNLPAGFRFQNARYVPPLHVREVRAAAARAGARRRASQPPRVPDGSAQRAGWEPPERGRQLRPAAPLPRQRLLPRVLRWLRHRFHARQLRDQAPRDDVQLRVVGSADERVSQHRRAHV